jgi:hypothetical protein
MYAHKYQKQRYKPLLYASQVGIFSLDIIRIFCYPKFCITGRENMIEHWNVDVFQQIVEGRVKTREGALTLLERLLVYVKTVTMATTANTV